LAQAELAARIVAPYAPRRYRAERRHSWLFSVFDFERVILERKAL
jgi:hypothetical protein